MCESELYATRPCSEIHLYSNPSVYRCVGVTTVDVRVCGSPGRDKDKREGKSPSSLLIKKENTSRTRLRDSTNTSERHRRHVYYTSSAAEQHNTTHCTQFPLHTHCTSVHQGTSFPFAPSEEARRGRVQNVMFQKDKMEQHKPVHMRPKHCEKWNQSKH